MDVITLLKKDHRSVEELFDRIRATEQLFGKQSLYLELREEFEAHASAEEDVVYTEMKRLPALKDRVEHSYTEHNEARDLIDSLDSMSPEDEKWSTILSDLKSSLMHHIWEEEDEIFPVLEEEVEPQRLEELATEFEHAKLGLKKTA